mgnify:CR=1 FL=1
MLIKFYYHTKYDTIKLNIINKYITNYNSKIYNKQKILKLIKKKENLINNYILSHEELYNLKYKLYFTCFSENIKKDIHNEIINISYKILQIEEKLNMCEFEENMLFDVYKIKSNKIKYYFCKYFC